MQGKIQHSIMQAAIDGIIVADYRGLIIDFNPAAERLFGISKDNIIGHSISRLMPADEAQQHDDYIQHHLQTGARNISGTGREVKAKRIDGAEIPIYLSTDKIEHDNQIYLIGICHDLSRYHALQNDRTKAEQRFQQLRQYQDEYRCELNSSLQLLSANQKLSALLDLRHIEEHAYDITQFIHQDDRSAFIEHLQRLTEDPDSTPQVSRFRLHSPFYKQPRWLKWTWNLIPASCDKAMHIQAFASDISEQVQSEEKAFFLATHDPLTGLWNRMQVEETLNSLLRQRSPQRQQDQLAVILLDIDRFKHINNSMSYHLGDDIIRETGYRLRALCEEMACHVARWGGDEFLLIIKQPGSVQQIRKRIQGIIEQLKQPVIASGRSIELSYSAGISLYPNDGIDTRTLLACADNAKHSAKRQGGNRICLHDEAHSLAAQYRFDIEQWLRPALQNAELHVYWQPKFELPEQRIIGFEALLRWPQANYGWISPADFVPVAEALGLDSELGNYVIDKVIQQQKDCLQQGFAALPVAINISAQHIAETHFARDTLQRLRTADLDPSYLAIEITETAILYINSVLVDNVRQLREAGVAVSIDDFGTGYSSLRSLAKLQLSALKIDKEFVDALIDSDDNEGKAVLAAMITLGASLGLELIAEGIEDKIQADQLAAMGCAIGQGFLLSPAVPVEDARNWLQTK